MIWKFAVAFFSMLALDIVWGYYTRHVVDRQAHRAATFAAFIVLFNGINTLTYVGTPITLIAVIAGAYAGTWLSCQSTEPLQSFLRKTYPASLRAVLLLAQNIRHRGRSMREWTQSRRRSI